VLVWVLFLGDGTVCVYAVLPAFLRSLLFSSSERSRDEDASNIAYICLFAGQLNQISLFIHGRKQKVIQILDHNWNATRLY
jgi:hypothetical protein